MGILNSIFDGLYGYEKLMLICGFVLFVFALAAITAMIVQRRDFKAAILLIVVAIALMGFPGIQAIKVSRDMVELDRIRSQPQAPTDPAQTEKDQALLASLQSRAGDNPLLQAQVSDGYRAIGDIDKAYSLASAVLKSRPSPEVQKTLVPVLTAKLNQVQAERAAEKPPATSPSSASATPASPTAATPAAKPSPSQQKQIALIANQLQSTSAPLPAESHLALAKAYVTLDQPQQARANVEAALRADPRLRVNPSLLQAAHAGSPAAVGH